MGGMDDIKKNNDTDTNDVNIVIQLTNKLYENDSEIKKIRKQLKLNENESDIIIEGLLNRIKELENINAQYKEKLKELGAKQEYLDSREQAFNDAYSKSIEVLNNKETIEDNDVSKEELEVSTKKALSRLEKLLNSIKLD